MLQVALDSLDGLEQDSLVVYRCQQALRRIIHTCWTVTGQGFPGNLSPGHFSEQNASQGDQRMAVLGFTDNTPYPSSQIYPSFASVDPWIGDQVDLDLSWVNALAENLQVFYGDF